MHWLFIGFLFVLPVSRDETPGIIASYRNNNRLILLFAPDNRSSHFEKALLNLSRDPLGLDKRDILIFEIFRSGGIMPDGSPLSEKEADTLRNYYQIDPGSFRIVLINMDNDEIRRFSEPVTGKAIFTEFDTGSDPVD